MTETVPVEFAVLGIEPIRGNRIIAVANVSIDVAGIGFTLQGVRVVRQPDGSSVVEGPHWRHPRDGIWHPAVILPPELREAIGAEVLAAMGGG